MLYLFSILLILATVSPVWPQPSISPSLFFSREYTPGVFTRKQASIQANTASVTLRFDSPPSPERIRSIELCGVTFSRKDGEILHTRRIYPATVILDSLEALSRFPEIVRIEDTSRPVCASTLDVSNPQVQASLVWNLPYPTGQVDGSGVTVVNVDTGIDIYHPAFFKPDGGEYAWIDVNGNGTFDSGVDAVDLNGNGTADPREHLCFYDAPCADALSLIPRVKGVYDADLDWLYNDANGNRVRDYGPEVGYGETDPCFGEQFYVINDANLSNRLEPGETLIGLRTSRVRAIFDKNGTHLRGQSLMSNTGDTLNHGTGSSGIVGGNLRGRRLTGMAPGVEFILINHFELDSIEPAVIEACKLGGDIFMYEYGSWVYEFLDGSSNLEVMIDDLHEDGYHQFTASGNLAGPTRKRHAFVTVPRNDSDTVTFTVPDIGITQLYMSIVWRSGSKPALTLSLPGYSCPLSGDAVKRTYGALNVISGFERSPSGTSKMDVLVTSSARFSGNFSVEINNQRPSPLDTHLYVADNITHWMNGTSFTSHVTDDGTICTPGSATKGTTVGAYDPRGTRNGLGDINDFSSRGKTVDGRMGVEITAPGTLVYSLNASVKSKTLPGGYFEFGGTSAALPHAVGCAALILQLMPEISPDDLCNALISGAESDALTGAVPNDVWGYGKLRIFNVFSNLNLVPTGVAEEKPSAFTVSHPHPNPFNASVSFTIQPANMELPVRISIYNILGQRVFHRVQSPAPHSVFTWNGRSDTGAGLASGLYFTTFQNGSSIQYRKVTFMK